MAQGAVVIVGGTQGLGRRLAERYAQRGSEVLITGRDEGRASAVAAEIGVRTRGAALDLAEPALIGGCFDRIGAVDRLVLAAIERDSNKVREYDIDRAIRLATLKLVGYTQVLHCLHGRIDDSGSVLLFGGQAKERPYPGSTTVTSVNGGVTTMVRTFAHELAPIRVNAIHPGIVGDSPQWINVPAVLDATLKRTLTGRLVTMDEVTDAALFLLENGAVNGVNLEVDGGLGDELMRVAVLGLGQMGAPIAERLEGAGHELSVYNRSPGPVQPFAERGARTLDRPSQAWEHADVAITMLADGTALSDVALGPEGLLAPAQTGLLVDMSTISAATPSASRTSVSAAADALLAAPVSGNPSVVRAGNLGIIVSGPKPEYERVHDLLADIGPNVMYVGPGHEARIVKLAVNLILAGTTELLAEALVLAEKHGIERSTLLNVIGGSAAASPFVKYKTDALIADDYSSTFTARLLYKDLALALAAAHDQAVPLPLTASTQQLVEGCIASGMGDLDMTALLPRLRREAGL